VGFHRKGAFMKQSNTRVLISSTSSLILRVTVQVSIVSKRANEIIKPSLTRKIFPCK